MSGLLPALRPRPRPTSGRWLVATAVVGAACVGAGVGVFATAALMERELSPVIFTLPAPQLTQVVAPPAEAAPASVPCVQDADPDPAGWTFGEDHVGPFFACDAEDLDLEAARAALPALTITRDPEAMGPEYLVAFEGTPHLRLRPSPGGPYVTIESRRIAPPWGTRVGDRVRSVRARHRDLRCHYGAADGDESLTCFRSAEPDFGTGDGWRDSLQYDVDTKQLTHAQREALAGGGTLPARAFDDFVVRAIRWAPSSRR